jgi:hypothetical protein
MKLIKMNEINLLATGSAFRSKPIKHRHLSNRSIITKIAENNVRDCTKHRLLSKAPKIAANPYLAVPRHWLTATKPLDGFSTIWYYRYNES